jgi:flagellar biosynthetic protein FliP
MNLTSRSKRNLWRFAWLVPALILLPDAPLMAAGWLETLTFQDGSTLSTPLRLLVMFTVLSLVPSIVLMTTCFPRILIVLGFLRRAMGTQELPPTQVVVGLALFLTVAIMAPTWQRIYADAVVPYSKEEITDEQALELATRPLKDFMRDRTYRKDLRLFVEVSRYEEYVSAKGQDPAEVSIEDLPLTVLAPAFLLSELKLAFQMGFVLYLPFLVIDMVVATTLISMGMLVLPPFMISLPLKVLVFVLVDGWNLIVAELVKSVI